MSNSSGLSGKQRYAAFLLTYWISPHAIYDRRGLNMLFLRKSLRTSLDLYLPKTDRCVRSQQSSQVTTRDDKPLRSFQIGDSI